MRDRLRDYLIGFHGFRQADRQAGRKEGKKEGRTEGN